jgi:putative ubiquitin-RnfH superfamily antitoxin RatB of RatAB toxin-antitoxin module
MSFLRGLYLSAGVCLAVTVSHAQSTDTLTGKLANFPSRLFGKIQSQSTSLNQQLTSQTQQYLARMARREQRMQQKLSTVDSNAAKSLFANSQQQYAALGAQIKADTGGRKATFSGQYHPYADTLQGAMAFLQQHPQVLASGTAAKLQGASTQFQALQAKMQDADIVKAYVQSRQQQISQYLAAHENLVGALGKPLAGMQQEQVYYAQRVQQYKAMLSDPSALAQQALSMLGRLPAFQSFMTTHSQLGSLFHLPGNYSSVQAVNGLQTKEQVAGLVKSQVSAGGAAGASAMQANLQSAESALDGYKDKLSKLGLGGGDAQLPVDPKTNDQHTKSFLGRLQYSFNFQTTHNSIYYPSLLTLGLGLGYKLGHSNVIGIGASYEMGTGNGINHIAITGNGIGLRSFATIKIKTSFSLYAGLEYNYTTPFTTYQQLKQLQYWTRSGLIGVQKTVSMKSNVFKQTTLALLWDFLSYQQVPQTQPLIFRIGYSL